MAHRSNENVPSRGLICISHNATRQPSCSPCASIPSSFLDALGALKRAFGLGVLVQKTKGLKLVVALSRRSHKEYGPGA